MGKIYDGMTAMIKEAMKAKDKDRLMTYRNIKKEFGDVLTAPDNNVLNDARELQILKKMAKTLQEDIENAEKLGRPDAAAEAKTQLECVKSFLPKEATVKDIRKAISAFMEAEPNGAAGLTQKDMGRIVKYVKAQLPNADGKMVATEVKCALAAIGV